MVNRFPKTIRRSDTSTGTLEDRRLLMAFREPTDLKAVQALVREFGLITESLDRPDGNSSVEINHTEQRYWLRTVNSSAISEELLQQLERSLGNVIEWIGPVYRVTDAQQRVDLVGPIPTVVLIRKQLVEKLRTPIAEFSLKQNETKSKFLSEYDYFELPDARKNNAFQVQSKLTAAARDIVFEYMPMIRDWCVVPNDTLFGQQWNMTRIQGPQAWDMSTGSNAVNVAVLDSGVDLSHPDLSLANTGIDLGDMVSDGSPNSFGTMTGHGTSCAGIAAAIFNNNLGVCGIAGSCRILPIAIRTFSDVEIANGVNWALANGASSISMSFTTPQSALIDTELTNAFAANVVLCAATGNSNLNGIGYPARHGNVMAIGASDQVDNRKTPSSPDAETWGSNFGNEMSVVAPGVRIPTTDIQGTGGFEPSAGTAGDYVLTFNGTSSATPHVAGLAALIRSQYGALSSAQIRNTIERTAEKVGSVAYAETAGRPNGTWNQEMGYGRINAFRCLDFADVIIKDWSGDTGAEPSTAGNFWDFSDIVVRITDDGIFNPSNPTQSKSVERGQTNYIYIQVTNLGPREARNVVVSFRITPYVGLQFVFPDDWTAVDAMHVEPTSIVSTFASIPAGGTAMAKFSITAAQVESLYGWQTSNPWHPCLLAQVSADNDYSRATADLSFGNIVVRKNDFAQRNLSVIDVLASASLSFPFIIGNRFSKADLIRLNIDRRHLPSSARVKLKLTNVTSAFPQVDFRSPSKGGEGRAVVLLDRTQVMTSMDCCGIKLTLEKGSKIEWFCAESSKLTVRKLQGGELVTVDGEQLVHIGSANAVVDFDVQPGEIYALAAQIDFPANIQRGEEYSLAVYQSNENNQVLGGATAIYRVQ